MTYLLARETAASSRTLMPGTVRSKRMSSATLWLMPFTHGVKIMAAELVLLICVLGSAVPAFFNTRGQSWAVTIVTWGGLAVLKVLLMIPGCSLIMV